MTETEMLKTARIQRRMEKAAECVMAFEALIDCTDVEIPQEGLLAGPVQLNFEGLEKKLNCPAWQMLGSDNQHFAMNMEMLLRLGFSGIAREARKNAERLAGEEAEYLEAIARCHEAAMGFVGAHADEAQLRLASASGGEDLQRLEQIACNCRALSEREPRTFSEAVQLSWFAWCMRRYGWGGTIGRLDQHLYPFYIADLEAGRLTREEAFELLCELWEGYNRAGSGDTLSNLMLGGQDRNGNDATNELSYLMIDVALAVRKSEPHLSVRIHAGMPESFLDKVAELQLLGHGQGTIYHDECIIPELVKLSVPLASARNYANDGCTEVTIDGESGISMAQMEAVKALELTLFNGQHNPLFDEPLQTVCELGFQTGDFSAMTSFEEVYDAFLGQYLHQIDVLMNWLCGCIRSEQEDGVSSPFLAGAFPECLKSGRDPFRGGFTIPCQVIFSGSIPTVADGLYAIQQVAFEKKACTPTELLEALRADFIGHEPLRQHLLRAPKFGNDDDRVDEIAADIARRFCELVRQHPSPTGKPFWPALYNFTFNSCAKSVGATPDGRRWKEPIAEHYSPTPGRAKSGPTAVIRSACKGPLSEACGAAIFHISLSRDVAPANARGQILLKQLLTTALELGVAIMNTAIYDVDMMRDAKLHPERHEDLIVRVWGYSARFIDLNNDMQDHIIERVISG